MEIPSSIKYDFLLVVIGGILLSLPIYFDLFNQSREISFLFWLAGAIFFIIGFSEVKYNYDMDIELKELEHAKRLNEYMEYFDNKNLLSKEDKKKLLREIKEIIQEKP